MLAESRAVQIFKGLERADTPVTLTSEQARSMADLMLYALRVGDRKAWELARYVAERCFS